MDVVVWLRSLGLGQYEAAFRVKHRTARNGRNPRNGAFIAVNQKNMPHFKPGKEMHERLNKAQG